jgi:hypothetical protein
VIVEKYKIKEVKNMHVKKEEGSNKIYLMDGSNHVMEIPDGERGTIRETLVKVKEDLKNGGYEFKNYANIEDGKASIGISNSALWGTDPVVYLSSRDLRGASIKPSDVDSVIQSLDDYQAVSGNDLSGVAERAMKRILGNYTK